MSDNNSQPQIDTERYPLDEITSALLAEIKGAQEQLQRQYQEQVQQLALQAKGALVLFLRQHKLEGNWRPVENGQELERIPDQKTEMP